MLTAEDARRLTERIRTALDRFSTSWADLAERVGEAYERRADLALGYESWSEYASAEFHPAEGLAASVRQQVVGLLSAKGMSTRAIAPVVGSDFSTVSRDRAKVLQDATPETGRVVTREGVVLAEVEHHDLIDFTTGEVITDQQDEPAPRPAQVVGLDGKSYSRPESKASRRPALTDAFWRATQDLTRKVESVVRLATDDRFGQNAEKVAMANRSDLIRAIEALQRVVAQLPERNIS